MQKRKAVGRIATVALLIAISVILSRLCVIYITPSIRINFGNIPIMLAGILFGPLLGAMAGASADIIGSVLLSALGWYPPLTVSAAIMGLVPGIMMQILKRKLNWLNTVIIVFASNLCGTIIWTTYWLSKLYNTSIWVLASVRVPLYLGMTLLESIVLYAVLKALSKEIRGEIYDIR